MLTLSYKELSEKLEAVHPQGDFTFYDISELLNIDRSNASALLRLMTSEGRIQQPYKRGRTKLYRFA